MVRIRSLKYEPGVYNATRERWNAAATSQQFVDLQGMEKRHRDSFHKSIFVKKMYSCDEKIKFQQILATMKFIFLKSLQKSLFSTGHLRECIHNSVVSVKEAMRTLCDRLHAEWFTECEIEDMLNKFAATTVDKLFGTDLLPCDSTTSAVGSVIFVKLAAAIVETIGLNAGQFDENTEFVEVSSRAKGMDLPILFDEQLKNTRGARRVYTCCKAFCFHEIVTTLKLVCLQEFKMNILRRGNLENLINFSVIHMRINDAVCFLCDQSQIDETSTREVRGNIDRLVENLVERQLDIVDENNQRRVC